MIQSIRRFSRVRRPASFRIARWLGPGIWAAMLVLFFLTPAVLATAPQLASIRPTGGQRGTELTVQFLGNRLDDAEEVIVYGPGLEVGKLKLVTNKVVKAQVKIASDCRLGEHHFRLRTRTGVSELRTFFVGPFPAVAEKEPNNERAKAQPVQLNTTVTGVVPREDMDFFVVDAKKGQLLSAEVEGMRLGRGEFDPRLTIWDERGEILADSDDSWLALQDTFLTIKAPRDGKYVVQLREAAYGGRNDAFYRLHIGEFPRPNAVYPVGGQAGETLELRFHSPATGDWRQSVRLPAGPREKYGVFAERSGLVAPSPNWIRVSPFPNVLEAPPNQDRQHATAANAMPPLAFNGILLKAGETDWFRFKANKGQALEVSAYARRMRSPVDSIVDVFDANGKYLKGNDDSGQADSSFKFTPGLTTNYYVRMRDHLKRGGPNYTYRVEITPVTPKLSVKIPNVARNDTQSRQTIVVPRGNRFGTLISARRADFGGDLVIAAEDLPAGVTMHGDRMWANITTMPLVFEAAPDAPIGGRLLDLTATWTNQNQTVLGAYRNDIELVRGPNNTSYYGTRVDQLYVAVTEAAPFQLRIVEPKVPLVRNGSMQLRIVAEREKGFAEPIRVRMLWNPPGVSSQSEAQLAKGATRVNYQLNANGGAATRKWKIAVLGWATVHGGPLYVSSPLATLEVATPFLAGKIKTLTVPPGQSGKLVCVLDQQKPFAGKAKIRLHGLPSKVTTVEQEFGPQDKEIGFALNVDKQCRAGTYRNLFCSVEIRENGEVIPHTIAGGGMLRVIPPKKKEKAPAKLAAAKAKRK